MRTGRRNHGETVPKKIVTLAKVVEVADDATLAAIVRVLSETAASYWKWMTIAAGFIYRNGIVLCADSQETVRDFKWPVRKLFIPHDIVNKND